MEVLFGVANQDLFVLVSAGAHGTNFGTLRRIWPCSHCVVFSETEKLVPLRHGLELEVYRALVERLYVSVIKEGS